MSFICLIVLLINDYINNEASIGTKEANIITLLLSVTNIIIMFLIDTTYILPMRNVLISIIKRVDYISNGIYSVLPISNIVIVLIFCYIYKNDYYVSVQWHMENIRPILTKPIG